MSSILADGYEITLFRIQTGIFTKHRSSLYKNLEIYY